MLRELQIKAAHDIVVPGNARKHNHIKFILMYKVPSDIVPSNLRNKFIYVSKEQLKYKLLGFE